MDVPMEAYELSFMRMLPFIIVSVGLFLIALVD